MTDYLLDTNILLRASDRNSNQHSLANQAVYYLLNQGHQCLLTPQILIEFWVVCTRPVEANGFGWTTKRSETQINQFLSQFSLLSETSNTFSDWFQMVTKYEIKGKRTHDIKILAVMKSYGISHILTFNPNDFIAVNEFTIVHPQAIINS
ncbi:MAG: type II toxin-antitoxin system VapC family toxin [Halothece sp.]